MTDTSLPATRQTDPLASVPRPVLGGAVLLSADLTRLSRSQELAPLLDRLRFRGVRVVGMLDGFDSDSPQARMQAGLSGLMSDELRASIRVRTHSALQMRANAGRPTGGKVYGYDRAGQVVESEAVRSSRNCAHGKRTCNAGHVARRKRNWQGRYRPRMLIKRRWRK